MFAAKSHKFSEDFLTYLATYLSQTMDITHLRHLIAFSLPKYPTLVLFL